MSKNTCTLIFLVFLILLSIVSCQMKVEPMITANIDQCEHCTMIIQDIDHGSVLIDSMEEIHTYCSPVCMILEKDNIGKVFAQNSQYLFDHNNLSAIPVSKAFIVHGDFNTAMGHGLLAFADKTEADQFAIEMNGEILDWNELRIRYESPDNIINLSDNPQNVEVAKNNLIFVTYNNITDEDITINLLGYQWEMMVPANSSDSSIFIASKPGQGFVFQTNGKENLSALFVTGDHTSEEATYK
ncbi:MAG: hypothetical protein GY865_07595 [candidate division Zixibacteria bacterium]|nr:hypothetical protein [candidate division Zixibacteria bacterium]